MDYDRWCPSTTTTVYCLQRVLLKVRVAKKIHWRKAHLWIHFTTSTSIKTKWIRNNNALKADLHSIRRVSLANTDSLSITIEEAPLEIGLIVQTSSSADDELGSINLTSRLLQRNVCLSEEHLIVGTQRMSFHPSTFERSFNRSSVLLESSSVLELKVTAINHLRHARKGHSLFPYCLWSRTKRSFFNCSHTPTHKGNQ